jgi:hypothetical protein
VAIVQIQHTQGTRRATNGITPQSKNVSMSERNHFTELNYVKVPTYTTYVAKYPDGRDRAGSAAIISKIYKQIRTCPVWNGPHSGNDWSIEDWDENLTISAIYCPPPYRSIKWNSSVNLLTHCSTYFWLEVTSNAKHQYRSSRLTTPIDWELCKIVEVKVKGNILEVESTGEPSYWPTYVN